MQLKPSIILLAAGIGAATAQTHTTTTTADGGTTTTAIQQPTPTTTTSIDSFSTTAMNRFNLDRIGTNASPTASIIAVNTASPDIVTYLIKCGSASNSTGTASSASASPTRTSVSKTATSCDLPPEGATLVNGLGTAGYTYTATHSGTASRIREDCTIASPTPTLTVGAEVTCTWVADGPDVTAPRTRVDTLAAATVRYMTVEVTGGVQKLEDASAAVSSRAAAARTASSTGGAAAVATGAPLKILPTVGIAGAVGVLAAAVAL